MNPICLAAAAPLVLAAVASAQLVTVPPGADGADWNASTSIPFGYRAYRSQQIVDASTVAANSAMGFAIAFRANRAIGASLFGQSAIVHRPSNALGVVTSEAAVATTGSPRDDLVQQVVSDDPAAADGRYAFGPLGRGGAVVQLLGTFQ